MPVIEPRLVEMNPTPAQPDQSALPPGVLIRPRENGLDRDSWPMMQLDADPE